MPAGKITRSAHVFISYSSHDADLANQICAGLEDNGIPCWIAPRDVESGAYAASIIRAIRSAKALLFIASRTSGESGHVSRELERAVDAGVPILPLRIDDAEFSEELEYYLAGMHWTDLSGQSATEILPQLTERLSALGHTEREARSQPEVTKQRRSVSERALTLLLVPPPTLVGLCLSAIGLAFLLIAAFIGIAEYRYLLDHDGLTVEKEVGFLWAFNWSVSLILVYPAIAGIGLQALREMVRISDKLVKRRMIVDAAFRTERTGHIDSEIRSALRRGIGITLALAPVLFLYAAWEFHTVIGQHFVSGASFPDRIPLTHGLHERDWSVAALLPAATAPEPSRWTVYAFSLCAYLWLVGFGTTLVLTIFISFVAFAAAIYRLSTGSNALRIIPDLRDPQGRRTFDPRCGFEIFEPLFRHSMIVVLLSFVALFLVTVQNTYLRLPDAHILDYILPNPAFPDGPVAEFVGGGSDRSPLANLNGALSAAIGGMLFAMIVFGLAITLRNGARQARDLMLTKMEDQEEPMPVWLEESDRNEALARLDAMRFWPVRWLGLNKILATICLAAVSLLFHKIGIVVAILSMIYVISVSFDTGR